MELSAQEMIESVKSTQDEEPIQESTHGSAGTNIDTSTGKGPEPKITWDPQALKYVVDGKEIVEPWEMVQKRAQLGYKYSQRAEALNQRESVLKQIEERNKALSRWEEYDKYAQSNPQWNDFVRKQWEAREALKAAGYQQQDGSNPLNSEVEALKQQLDEIRNQTSETVDFQTKLRTAVEDKQFAQEIESVSKKYPDFDFSATDEQGESLEYRVLKHMKQLGLDASKAGQFESAFKDLYFDNLIAKREEAAREKYAKELAKQKKEGLLRVSEAPSKSTSFNGNIRGITYDNAAELAKKELGLI